MDQAACPKDGFWSDTLLELTASLDENLLEMVWSWIFLNMGKVWEADKCRDPVYIRWSFRPQRTSKGRTVIVIRTPALTNLSTRVRSWCRLVNTTNNCKFLVRTSNVDDPLCLRHLEDRYNLGSVLCCAHGMEHAMVMNDYPWLSIDFAPCQTRCGWCLQG